MMQGLRWRVRRGPVAPLLPFAVLFPLLAASGCSSSTDPEPEVDLDLERAALRWERRGPEDYVFIYEQICECLPPARVVLTVEDGDVVGAAGLPADPPSNPDLENYPTIDELFERLRRDAAAGPVTFEVQFDAELGFPTSAVVDVRAEIADDAHLARDVPGQRRSAGAGDLEQGPVGGLGQAVVEPGISTAPSAAIRVAPPGTSTSLAGPTQVIRPSVTTTARPTTAESASMSSTLTPSNTVTRSTSCEGTGAAQARSPAIAIEQVLHPFVFIVPSPGVLRGATLGLGPSSMLGADRHSLEAACSNTSTVYPSGSSMKM